MRIIKNGVLLATPFLSVTVDSVGERGLLGVAFDPNFATNGYIYAYYTATSPTTHNRVSRFTADPTNPDKVLSGSEFQVLNLETLSTATNHNGGAIHFGKDGRLYVGVGDNANSANSQSLSTRLGKILRINPDGTIPSDNPFFNTVGAKQEIWALGLRNPFTFAFSPAASSTLMYINDVGQDTWEEIDSGVKGANYGWPTCEGVCSNPSFVNPIYAYNHNGAGAAISGGAFYESTQFPSDYKSNYFFGDYVRGFIKRLTPTNQSIDFLSGLNSPVDIKVGEDGSLYYLSIGAGEVHKVQYVAGTNTNPVAAATASPTSGPFPLTVTFNGTMSSDPDPNTVLSYSWNFGDGSSVATGAIVTHTYNTAGPYTATLTVTDGAGGVSTANVNISVGTPPVGTITTPVQGTKYNAGDTISFSGSATDAEDGVLPASAFNWVILLHHNTHTHPFLNFVGITNGSFTIPTLGETSDDVWYRIYLTITDSSGLTQTTTRDVTPNKSTVTLSSNVPGLQVNLDGIPETTPYSFVGVVGFNRTIAAPNPQTFNGQSYGFNSWSDGGAATHSILTPSINTTYTASFSLVTPPPPSTSRLTIMSQDLTTGSPITGMWTVLNQGSTRVATGFTPSTFNLSSGVSYSIGVGNYGSLVFDHWLDNGSAGQPRTINISADTTLTAIYRSTATLSLNPTSGSIGTSVTATGTGFAANSAVTIRYDGVTLSTTPSTITTSSAGAFSASFVVPSSSTVGSHIIKASTAGGYESTATFTQNSINPPPTPKPTTLNENTVASLPWSSSLTIAGRLTESQTGNGIGGATISLAGNGTSGIASTSVNTAADGTFTFTGLSPSNVGKNWMVQAHYAGDGAILYASSDSQFRAFDTILHQSALSLSPASGSIPWGSATAFNAILTDVTAGSGNTPIPSALIHYDGTGVIGVTDKSTDPTGKATGTGTSPNSVASGWTARAHYLGDSKYAPADSGTATYSTTAHATTLGLTITPSTVRQNTGTYGVNGVLSDQITGTKLASKTISFIATSPITISNATTDASGAYSISGLKAPKAGSYQITAKYGGETLYFSSTSPVGVLISTR